MPVAVSRLSCFPAVDAAADDTAAGVGMAYVHAVWVL